MTGGEPVGYGLCAHCQHAQQIQSDRGSRFVLCGKSAVDPRFPRYPRLPVLECSGFTPLQLKPAPPN